MLLLKFLKIFHLLRFQEFVNSAEMFANATMTELINLADKTIEEIAVVTNHDERSVEIKKCLFQHILGLQVEVVGRLIENQQIHRLQQQLENGKAGALASRHAYPVQMSDVAMSFDDKKIFSGVNLTVERGDKIAFVGRNGEGKSTLVKCIMGQLQNEGKLELGHNVQIGYFAQNQASLLDGELTVFQTIDDVAKGEIRNKIRDLLGAFMFGGEASTKKVKVLSGGERTRLALLKLLLEPVNLLILDEPTNHLDLRTKDVLKQALNDFDGTLICASHDRDFLKLPL